MALKEMLAYLTNEKLQLVHIHYSYKTTKMLLALGIAHQKATISVVQYVYLHTA